MKNPLRVLSSLFQETAEPPAPPMPVPPSAGEPAIKVEVPPDVVAAAQAAASIKPPLPREDLRQHNRAVEQRLKAASLHRPVITRGLPHARGR